MAGGTILKLPIRGLLPHESILKKTRNKKDFGIVKTDIKFESYFDALKSLLL